jgi:DNA-binding MarR family transcriptional regulator
MASLRADQVTTLCAAVVGDCACEGLRRAARAISRVYGGALAGLGLTPTQLAILVATRLRGSLPLSRLAEGLRLDRTSLYRAIRPLERAGYLEVSSGQTQRERVATVTPKGGRILQAALPIWQRTQEQFVEALGPRAWTALSSGLKQVVSVAEVLEPRGGARRRPRRKHLPPRT